MFQNQQVSQLGPIPVPADPFATSAVAVLPGVPLPSTVLAAQSAELPAEPVAEQPTVVQPSAVAPAVLPPHLVAATASAPEPVAPVPAQAVAPAVPVVPAGPPAGWYPDPAPEGDGQRYWDGAAWTHHLAP